MKNYWQRHLTIIVVTAVIAVALLLSIIATPFMERLLYLRPKMVDSHTMQVHFIDVGQGSATAIRFNTGKTMLIDSGTSAYRGKLDSYLRNVFFADTARKWDYVVLTHSDVDHSGNMEYILDNYQVGTFYRPNIVSTLAGESGDGYKDGINEVYGGVITKLKANKINVITSGAGVVIADATTTYATMYSPTTEYADNTNDYSPIMIISNGGLSICITGDASDSVEKSVLDDVGDVDILLAGHHGSATSNCAQFVEAITPERVVVSAGANSYGHPSSELYDTLLNYDKVTGRNTMDTLLVTRDKGNIVYYVSEGGYNYYCIGNVDYYLFVPYYVIVIISLGVLGGVYLVVTIKKDKAKK